jgi:hypothetical protein
MKAKRRRSPDQRADDRERGRRVEQILQQRMAHHRRKLRNEGREPKTLEELLTERRREYERQGRDLPSLEERIVAHEARRREENDRRPEEA